MRWGLLFLFAADSISFSMELGVTDKKLLLFQTFFHHLPNTLKTIRSTWVSKGWRKPKCEGNEDAGRRGTRRWWRRNRFGSYSQTRPVNILIFATTFLPWPHQDLQTSQTTSLSDPKYCKIKSIFIMWKNCR